MLVFLGVAVWYLTWRLGTFNPQAKVFSWLLYAAELYALLTTLLHLFMTWCLTGRSAPPPAVGLSVDVFISTINEPVDMLRHTLLAAVHMDYAHETWLLDDGNRAEMAALARDLGCRHLARTENKDAKAGNFNNALKQSGQISSPFSTPTMHPPEKLSHPCPRVLSGCSSGVCVNAA